MTDVNAMEGATDAADRIALLQRAIAGLPGRYRHNLLSTADRAGAIHDLPNWDHRPEPARRRRRSRHPRRPGWRSPRQGVAAER